MVSNCVRLAPGTCRWCVSRPAPLTRGRGGSRLLPRAAGDRGAGNLESRIPRGADRTAEIKPAHTALDFFSNLSFLFLSTTGAPRGPGALERRVRSWLRMNAGGAPNTCKSSGDPPFGAAISGERVSNAWATNPPPGNSRRKRRVTPGDPAPGHPGAGIPERGRGTGPRPIS